LSFSSGGEFEMTETIQQLKEDIALLQMKLQKLEETQMTLEKSGEFSIVSYNGETYYRNLYDGICGGWYKTDTDGEVFYLVEDKTERKLEKLYQEQVVVKEPEKWDVVRESVKWCEEHREESVEEYLKPHTPEKTEQLLREAFQKVQQTEEWKETQRKIDSNYEEKVEEEPKPMNEVLDRLENKYNDDVVNRMLKKWEENPPSFLRFELGKTLEALITRWWDDVYDGIHQDWDREVAIDDLVDRIQLWLPKFQSAVGSQNVDTELLVDGYNDALTKIKSKLRNKK
jgi:hydroxymethylpyrimidine pyrophosphatase-like HAD family hydrolase